MRHRLGHNGLSRPTAHRVMMLRNMVSSLLEHEQITTTVAKAKEAQKLAEKVIGWGKQGDKAAWDRANSYLLNPTKTLRPLFTTFAERYASRPGGYTRLNRAGFRVGDRAAVAVLSLVDSNKDLKYEQSARAVGRELALRAKAEDGAGPEGWWTFRERILGVAAEAQVNLLGRAPELEELTRKNVVKALQFRTGPSYLSEDGEYPEADEDSAPAGSVVSQTTAAGEFLERAHHHYLASLATFSLSTAPHTDPERTIQQLTSRLRPSDARGAPLPVLTVPKAGRVRQAGQRLDGWEAEEGAEVSQFGGPIGRAKGSRGRQARRQVYTGSKQSEEALAQ